MRCMGKGVWKRLKSSRNKGFSLVEVLVAMCVIAVVAIPLMRSMQLTQRLNIRSRASAQAETVAANIMEGLQPLSAEEIRQEFVAARAEEGAARPVSFIVNRDGEGNQEDTVFSEKINISDQNPDDHIYTYWLKNIKQGGRIFDAVITLNAEKYYRENEDPEAQQHNYNQMEYSSVANYNSSRDEMIIYNESQDRDVYSQIKLAAATRGINLSDAEIAANLVRRINLYVKNGRADNSVVRDNSQGTVELDIQCGCEIRYEWYGGNGFDLTTVTPPRFVVKNEKVVMSAADYDAQKSAKNIFILYYPNYESGRYDGPNRVFLDSFSIDNPDNMPVNIVIAKQKPSDDTNLAANEGGYGARVQLTETASSEREKTYAKIRTNLGVNIGNPAGARKTEDLLKEVLNQAEYILVEKGEGSDRIYSGNVSTSVIAQKMDIRSLVEGESVGADRLYDVRVEIYASGAFDKQFQDATPLVSLSSVE